MDCGTRRKMVSREYREIRLLFVIKGIIAGQKNTGWAGTNTAKHTEYVEVYTYHGAENALPNEKKKKKRLFKVPQPQPSSHSQQQNTFRPSLTP